MGRSTCRVFAGVAVVIGSVLVVAACLLLFKPIGADGTGQTPKPLMSNPLPSLPPADSVPGTILSPRPTPTESVKAPVQPAAPTRLVIPSIGANADVGRVMQTYDAAGNAQLAPPEQTYDDLMRAYWWSERQAPGYPVSKTTFIIGHTCHKDGCPAVFNSLQTIQFGALIHVSTSQGELTYKVFDTKTYLGKDIANAAEVYADVPNQLVLATCKLRSDGGVQTDRFVVWAKLVQSVTR